MKYRFVGTLALHLNMPHLLNIAYDTINYIVRNMMSFAIANIKCCCKYSSIFIIIISIITNLPSKASQISSQIVAEKPVHEKIVLSLNQNDYTQGDTIRFRAFLLDAYSNKELINFSQYIYVEIIDPFGEVINRVKIKNIEGVFAGHIILNPKLPEGNYTIAAYTMHMRNISSDYFLKCPLYIRSIFSYNQVIKLNIDSNLTTLNIYDRKSGKPLKCSNINIVDRNNTIVCKASDKSFVVFNSYDYSPVVKVTFDNYSRFIDLPSYETDLNIDFYPEGGYILEGCSNAVAVKVTDSFGRSLNEKGIIQDSSGQTICDFDASNSGLGIFYFIPHSGLDYYAVLRNRTFKLPISRDKVTALQVKSQGNDNFIIGVRGDVPDKTLLRITSKGVLQAVDTIYDFPVKVCKANLTTGFITISLYDMKGNVLSSRTVYNKATYNNSFLDKNSIPKGNFSISAYTGINKHNPLTCIIQQDIPDYIYNLDKYIKNSENNNLIDAISLYSQENRYAQNTYLFPVEVGGEISGKVLTRWRGKPLKNASVMVIAPSIGYADETKSDSMGRFRINGIDWPDGTTFVCQVLGTKGQREHNYTIDNDSFPSISPILLLNNNISQDSEEYYIPYDNYHIFLREIVKTATITHYDKDSITKAALGIKSINERQFKEKSITSYEEAIRSFTTLSISDGTIKSCRASSIGGNNGNVEVWVDGIKWLSSFRGPEPVSSDRRFNQVSNRIDRAVKMMTGGILPGDLSHQQFESYYSEIDELTGCFPFHMVKSIEYIPPQLALFVSNSAAHGGGALLITTKTGSDNNLMDNLFIKTLQPLGYQYTPENYIPHKTGSCVWIPITDSIPEDISNPKTNIIITGISDRGDFIYVESSCDP